MRVFLTGATGVIGRRLIPLLRASGHEVTAVWRSPASRADVERQGATAIALDLFDRDAVARAVIGHDAVVNLATHIPPSSGRMLLPGAWRENDRIRREGSATLVDAAIRANVSRFVQESFAPVYPDSGDRWIDESAPQAPVKYNRTVPDAEASADRFTRSGRTGIVLRFAGFYGPDATQTAEMISMVRKGWAPIPGPPNAYISSVSHDDAASAVAAAMTLPAGIYNVVDDEPVTHRVFFDSLASALNVKPPKLPPQWLTLLFGSVGEMLARSLRISNRKLRSASSWTPSLPSVREGWRAVVGEMRNAAGQSQALGF
jgi:nucleoside-diphosphate-sugar epimerase